MPKIGNSSPVRDETEGQNGVYDEVRVSRILP